MQLEYRARKLKESQNGDTRLWSRDFILNENKVSTNEKSEIVGYWLSARNNFKVRVRSLPL